MTRDELLALLKTDPEVQAAVLELVKADQGALRATVEASVLAEVAARIRHGRLLP